MKKTVIVGLLVGLCAGMSFAETLNPDKYPSVGLTYGTQSMEGTARVFFGSAAAHQDINSRVGVISIDGRIPLNDSFTLTLGIGAVATEATGEETTMLTGQKIKEDGSHFSIGMRYYFLR